MGSEQRASSGSPPRGSSAAPTRGSTSAPTTSPTVPPTTPPTTSPTTSPTVPPTDDPTQPIDIEEAFEIAGYGYFNTIALVSCSCVFMHSLIEMIALAYVLDNAECDLDLNVMQKTWISSAVFFGIILTATCWGALSDSFGRKKVMVPCIFGTIIMSTFSSLCTVFWTMFLLRLLTGCLVAASHATVLVYLGELNVIEHRDSAIAWAITAVAVAFVIVPAIGWAIIPGQWSFNFLSILIKPWRVFMWTFSVTGLIGVVIMLFLPESPRFVIAHDGAYAAIPILAKIWHLNHMKSPGKFPVTQVVTSRSNILHSGDSVLKSALHDIAQLFKEPMRRPFLITHFCMFMVFFLANGVYMWMPGMFNAVLADTKLSWSICDILKKKYGPNSLYSNFFVYEPHAGGAGMDCETGAVNTMAYPMAIIMEIAFLIPILIMTFIIEKYHKGWLYAGIMVPCGVFLFLSAVVPQVLVASTLMMLGLCSGAGASILSALAVDVFPTSLRALVMCTMFMVGQVGAVLGNTAVGFAATGPCHVVFFFMSALVAGSVASLLIFWPNVKKVRETMESRNFSY